MTKTERTREWRIKNPARYQEQGRENYARNKERIKQAAKAAYERKRAYLNELKVERGCVECGYNGNAAALQFHHRDPETKTAPVSTIAANGSWDALNEEIAKCDVVCANCHSIHHYGE